MAQQSAVEWLFQQECRNDYFTDEKINKAMEMQKKQMIDFGKKCQMVHDVEYGDGAVTFVSTPEEIYNQTYKTQSHDKQQG